MSIQNLLTVPAANFISSCDFSLLIQPRALEQPNNVSNPEQTKEDLLLSFRLAINNARKIFNQDVNRHALPLHLTDRSTLQPLIYVQNKDHINNIFLLGECPGDPKNVRDLSKVINLLTAKKDFSPKDLIVVSEEQLGPKGDPRDASQILANIALSSNIRYLKIPSKEEVISQVTAELAEKKISSTYYLGHRVLEAAKNQEKVKVMKLNIPIGVYIVFETLKNNEDSLTGFNSIKPTLSDLYLYSQKILELSPEEKRFKDLQIVHKYAKYQLNSKDKTHTNNLNSSLNDRTRDYLDLCSKHTLVKKGEVSLNDILGQTVMLSGLSNEPQPRYYKVMQEFLSRPENKGFSLDDLHIGLINNLILESAEKKQRTQKTQTSSPQEGVFSARARVINDTTGNVEEELLAKTLEACKGSKYIIISAGIPSQDLIIRGVEKVFGAHQP